MAEPQDIPKPLSGQAEQPTGFAYHYGDKPLDGYTVQRALGRGGFGEVYFALSDAGREVALKAIQGYEQIELRGVGQCMNLKSPHLVTIFDVRYNDAGKPFVIMEYVAGPSLRDLIDSDPAGIGTQKAAYFLREIAKGLTFLHECGIVHRDLKPGNIFWEDGYVKIGDYGLSKAIAASMHSQQTMTVGTVHYMAPEIGKGCYDRSIDIYALGAVAYEMLIGRPPYEGDSLGEVLMKHLSGKPDLHGVPEPFASAIDRALAKDPAARFQTVQQFVEAIFEPQHVRTSVSLFSPNELSLVAGRAARAIRGSGPAAGSSQAHALPDPPRAQTASEAAAGKTDSPNKTSTWSGPKNKPRKQPKAAAQDSPLGPDTMSALQRTVLSGLLVAMFALIGGVVSRDALDDGPVEMPLENSIALVGCMILGALGGVMLARWILRLDPSEKQAGRIGYGGLAAIGAALGMIGVVSDTMFEQAAGDALIPVAISMFAIDWRSCLCPTRKERMSLDPAFTGGLAAMVLAFVFGGSVWLSIAVVSGTALVAQMLLPKSGPKSARPRPRLPAEPAPGQPPARQRSGPNRWTAFGLTWLIFAGIGGIQRFYVGKVWSGLGYLLTFGLLGIGQLLDMIAILRGEFTDATGRKLTDLGQAPPVARPVVRSSEWDGIGRALAVAMLVVLLLVGSGLGLAVALDLPAVIGAGLPHPQVASVLETDVFGGPSWAGALGKLFKMAFLVDMLAVGVLLVILRRAEGPGAMARVIPGVAGLILSVYALAVALDPIPWPDVAAGIFTGKMGGAIDLFAGGIRGPMLLLAVLVFLVSVIILCWTSRRQAGERGSA